MSYNQKKKKKSYNQFEADQADISVPWLLLLLWVRNNEGNHERKNASLFGENNLLTWDCFPFLCFLSVRWFEVTLGWGPWPLGGDSFGEAGPWLEEGYSIDPNLISSWTADDNCWCLDWTAQCPHTHRALSYCRRTERGKQRQGFRC